MIYTSGIYLIRNTINDKVYVGQSIHVEKRWKEHQKSAKRGDKSHLYDAIRKYGVDSFELVILELCNAKLFDEKESYWMSFYNCRDQSKGYNLLPAGQFGRVMDDACRERIASKLRGRKLTTEQVEKIRLSLTGRKHSQETKEKISMANKNKVVKKESTDKIAAKLKARYEQLSVEEKIDYANKRKGYRHSQEARQKMSLAGKGKKRSEETKQKMRTAIKNESPQAKEYRLSKLRAANAIRWAKWREERSAT